MEKAEIHEVGALALTVYKRWRDSSSLENSDIARQVRSLENTLKDLEDHVTDNPLASDRSTRLQEVLGSNRLILEYLESLVQRFEALTVAQRQVWEDSQSRESRIIQDSKAQLTANVASTQSFYDELMESKETRIARALSHLIRQGDERKSKLLLQSTVDGVPEAWDCLVADLEDNGVDRETSAECRNYVHIWVQRAKDDGRLASVPEGIQYGGLSNFEQEPEHQTPVRKDTLTVPRKPVRVIETTRKFNQSPGLQVDLPILGVQAQGAQNTLSHSQSLTSSIGARSPVSVTLGDSGTAFADDISRMPSTSSASSPLQVWSISSIEKAKSIVSDNSCTDSDDDLYYAPKKLATKTVTHARSKSNLSTSRSQTYDPEGPLDLNLDSFTESHSTMMQSDVVSDRDPPENLGVKSPTQITVSPSTEEQSISPAQLTPDKILVEAPHFSASSIQPIDQITLFRRISSPTSSTAPERVMSPDPLLAPIPLSSSTPSQGPPPIPAKRQSPPPLPPKEPSPIPQTASIAAYSPPQPSLSIYTSQSREDIRRLIEEDPPSPIQEDFDLAGNSTLIVEAWNAHSWTVAYDLLGKQIDAVENGTFIVAYHGEPVQPNLRFLRHLQGVACSFAGDFNEASRCFKKVLERAHIDPPDIITLASARWLGENSIVINEAMNAAMAWGVAVFLAVPLFGITHPYTWTHIEDLRFLNQYTNSSAILKSYLIMKSKDLSTVFTDASRQWKLDVLTRTPEWMRKAADGPRPSTKDYHHNVIIDERMLTLPLTNHFSIPYLQDPTFRPIPAILLLSALSRPKMTLKPSDIRSTRIGHATKSLFFKTRRSPEWLIDGVRACLNAYSIEFKITGTAIVLRLSQTHSRIAYYQCFGLHFRKVAMRHQWGIKLSTALYTTRTFGSVAGVPQAAMLVNLEALPSAEVVRMELMERLSSFLQERDRNGGASGLDDVEPQLGSQSQPGMPELMSNEENSRFELAADPRMPAELVGSFKLPAELDDSGGIFRKKRRAPQHPEGAIELPA
jgi:hypothetical protein